MRAADWTIGMATLRSLTTTQSLVLEAAHTVGRSGHSSLRIPASTVSNQHAVIRWTGECWEVKDLGSLNGTFLDGRRLKRGEESRLRPGAVLAFGPTEQRWELTDDEPPEVMAIPLEGGPPVRPVDGLLAIPSADDPRITIYRADDQRWLMERESDAAPVPLANGEIVEADGRRWRICIPDRVAPTAFNAEAVRSLKDATLRFVVSQDEESVRVFVVDEGETFDLGSRSHNYLLLTLARRRLADAAREHAEAECGWTYLDELVRDPSASETQLNIDVFRIRKHFAQLALADAATIVERRPRLKQLRIGVPRIEIERG
jgi:hypothetical protein